MSSAYLRFVSRGRLGRKRVCALVALAILGGAVSPAVRAQSASETVAGLPVSTRQLANRKTELVYGLPGGPVVTATADRIIPFKAGAKVPHPGKRSYVIMADRPSYVLKGNFRIVTPLNGEYSGRDAIIGFSESGAVPALVIVPTIVVTQSNSWQTTDGTAATEEREVKADFVEVGLFRVPYAAVRPTQPPQQGQPIYPNKPPQPNPLDQPFQPFQPFAPK